MKLINPDRADVAVVRVSYSDPPAPLDVRALRTLLASLRPEVEIIVVSSEPLQDGHLAALVDHGLPTGTALRGVDALKRVHDGRIVGTLDRNALFVLRPPCALNRSQAEGLLANQSAASIPLADLVAPPGTPVRLVDEQGRLITPG